MTGHWGGHWSGDGWTVRIWAPDAGDVALILNEQRLDMTRQPDGFWSATARARAGDEYLFRIDGQDMPDPASRLQAGNVHGPSVVTLPADPPDPWQGREWVDAVIYELHLGTFTPQGTLAAAADKLADLATLGITAVEVMPIGQFPRNRGWGYDGVLPFALHPAYGTPQDLRRFVDHAHGLGLMVILDLVMPHLRQSGYDATWNDDFRHAIHCLLTGESDSYYASFARDPLGDLCLALQRGHVEEGQPRPGRDEPRGQPCGHMAPTTFVNSTQTHDQVGNRAQGERLLSLADPEGVRVAYALLLVAPFIPMIFMGEERGATTPFLFFADFSGDLAQEVRKGRAAEFAGIASGGDAVPDPLSPDTFMRSKLDWSDTDTARDWLDLTRRALSFRSEHVVPLLKSGRSAPVQVKRHGAALSAIWQFHGGTLELWLGTGPVEPEGKPPQDAAFAVGRVGVDRFALSVTSRPA